jgi:hypothetical protein
LDEQNELEQEQEQEREQCITQGSMQSTSDLWIFLK